MRYDNYLKYVEQQESHIAMLDDKIENLFNAGREAEAKQAEAEWREENQQLDAFIKKHQIKMSSFKKNIKSW
jgi:hypothetical protein